MPDKSSKQLTGHKHPRQKSHDQSRTIPGPGAGAGNGARVAAEAGSPEPSPRTSKRRRRGGPPAGSAASSIPSPTPLAPEGRQIDAAFNAILKPLLSKRRSQLESEERLCIKNQSERIKQQLGITLPEEDIKNAWLFPSFSKLTATTLPSAGEIALVVRTSMSEPYNRLYRELIQLCSKAISTDDLGRSNLADLKRIEELAPDFSSPQDEFILKAFVVKQRYAHLMLTLRLKLNDSPFPNYSTHLQTALTELRTLSENAETLATAVNAFKYDSPITQLLALLDFRFSDFQQTFLSKYKPCENILLLARTRHMLVSTQIELQQNQAKEHMPYFLKNWLSAVFLVSEVQAVAHKVPQQQRLYSQEFEWATETLLNYREQLARLLSTNRNRIYTKRVLANFKTALERTAAEGGASQHAGNFHFSKIIKPLADYVQEKLQPTTVNPTAAAGTQAASTAGLFAYSNGAENGEANDHAARVPTP